MGCGIVVAGAVLPALGRVRGFVPNRAMWTIWAPNGEESTKLAPAGKGLKSPPVSPWMCHMVEPLARSLYVAYVCLALMR